MLNQAQIQRVWEGMLLAEMRALYFADLANRYNALQRNVTLAVLGVTSGAAASMVAELPEGLAWISKALTFMAALLSYYLFAMQNQKRAQEATDLHYRWSQLAAEYESTWENVHADDALQRLDKADATAIELSKAGLHLPNRTKLVKKWQDVVEANWAARTAEVAHAA